MRQVPLFMCCPKHQGSALRMEAESACTTKLLVQVSCLRQREASSPMTYVLAKSASNLPKTGPRSMKPMSSSSKTLSGVSTCIGWMVLLPVRTRRLCQCLRVPKLAAASSKILSLISLSLSPAFKKAAHSRRFNFQGCGGGSQQQGLSCWARLIRSYVSLHSSMRLMDSIGELLHKSLQTRRKLPVLVGSQIPLDSMAANSSTAVSWAWTSSLSRLRVSATLVLWVWLLVKCLLLPAAILGELKPRMSHKGLTSRRAQDDHNVRA